MTTRPDFRCNYLASGRAEWLERKLQANREELERVHGEVLNACRKADYSDY